MKTINIQRFALLLAFMLSSIVGMAQYDSTYVAMFRNSRFVELGYKPTNSTKVVAKMSIVSGKGNICFFGSDNAGKNSYYVKLEDKKFVARMSEVEATYTCTDAEMQKMSNLTQHIYVTLSSEGLGVDFDKEKTRHDINAKFTDEVGSFSGAPIYLNAVNTPSGPVFGTADIGLATENLFEVWIYEEDLLVHHYYPSYTDSMVRLYDVVDQQYVRFSTVNSNGTISFGNPMLYTVNSKTCHHQFTDVAGGGKDMKFLCKLCAENMDVNSAVLSKNNEITTVDPMVDLQSEKAGTQTLSITCSNKMTSYMIVDSITKEVVVPMVKYSEPAINATVSLEYFDAPRTLMVVANTKNVDYSTNPSETTYGLYKTYVHYKPMHKITRFDVSEVQKVDDKTGLRTPANIIRFAIDNLVVKKGADGTPVCASPDSQDAAGDDMFIVQRAYTKDFKELENVGSFELSQIDSLEEVTEDNHTFYRGWYTVTDDNVDAILNTTENKDSLVFIGNAELLKNSGLTANEKAILTDYFSYPERHVYYRVVRALPYELWADCGDYKKEGMTNSACMLPPVSSIAVEKSKDWSETKKVSIKLRLDNPYPWEFNPLLDQDKVKKLFDDNNEKVGRRYLWDGNASIVIRRLCPDSEHADSTDYASKIMTISGKDVKWDPESKAYVATVEDVQNLPYLHYYYAAIVDNSASTFAVANNEYKMTTREEAEDCYSTNSMLIFDLKVSRGDVRGSVLVEWEQGDYVLDNTKVLRREYGDENGEWTELISTDEAVTSYDDKSAQIGKVYEYKVEGVMTLKYRKSDDPAKKYYECSNVLEDWGYMPYYGRLSGRVMMNNGTSMSGIKLRITRDEPIHIDDVIDRYGNVMMPGVHEGVDAHVSPRSLTAQDTTQSIIDKDKTFRFERTVVTDSNGNWSADSLIFTSEGSRYIVEVFGYQGVFEYMGQQGFPQITLSKSQYENTDVRLVYTSTKRVSGYAYYRNSTIPVPNANFYLDGVQLFTSNGEPVRTQPDGKFTLTVSSMEPVKTLEIRKPGHKFTDNGVMISNMRVEKDLDGFIMYDDTKVRLAGRVVGGCVEADKPLGYGLSKNNLGDDIKLVLQLEGDNSASIVYFPSEPNRDMVKETFDHINYRTANGVKDTIQVGKTTMTSERKRIIIDVDCTTGEYMADLYPAKYKVVQMYAKGYSTLYRANEGLAVIDLSEVLPGNGADDLHTEPIRDREVSVRYDATFNRTYHNPVKITYQQYEKGRPVDYFGESEVQVKNSMQSNTTPSKIVAKVKTKDGVRDSLVYSFGYPVFKSGTRYVFQVTTHEDYVYNNEQGNTIDIVPVPGDTLIVRNNVDSNNDEIIVKNNDKGMANISLVAGNPTFFDEGDAGLRAINFMVKSNGYYYEGESVRGFVLGERKMGTDVIALGDKIDVLDVLRDPPGAKSYAYREKGTQYHWDYSSDVIEGRNFNASFEVGVSAILGAGLGVYVGSEVDVTLLAGNFSQPLSREFKTDKSEYTMTLNERVTTSDNPLDQGAMSDVFIGKIDTYGVDERQAIAVFDADTYTRSLPAIEAGLISVLKEGTGADGKKCYLVCHDIYYFGPRKVSSFAYSQKYIVGTLIPSLKQKLETQLTVVNSKEEAEKLLAIDDRPVYWRSLTNPDKIEWNGYPKGGINVCDSILTSIQQWESIVRQNEKIKVELMKKEPARRHSIADAKVEHSESVSSYGMYMEWSSGAGKLQWSLSAGASHKPTSSHMDESFKWNGGKAPEVSDHELSIEQFGGIIIPGSKVAILRGKSETEFSVDESGTSNVAERRKDKLIRGGGVKLGFSVGGGNTYSANFSRHGYKVNNAGFGYVIETNDNGYMDVAVYNVTPKDQYIVNTDQQVNSKMDSSDETTEITMGDEAKIHNFVFVTEGGAMRNPWLPADSTKYYNTGTPLGKEMLKIDNPKIYVDKPVVNNITRDENAVFSIRLTNETEIQSGDHSLLHPSTFHLKVDDKSNPYGAKIYMDGLPISSGRDFTIAPGQSVTKTIEVERGTNEYNYDDLKLVFYDNMYRLSNSANISVHYLPTSTPLRLSVPTDKWVMNTYSQMDEEGKYYIPVEISDYSLTYDNFDHIDLQYKKATDGESQWVTLCSYYDDADLYAKASGKKAMIESGSKINNIKFYGGANVEEQEYNLRAVSYCRMGNDFVTRASDVVSGIKDTRRPEIFGVPTPTNGILSYDDVIQFPFTERIAYNHLNATSNFTVQGYTNELMGTFANPLHFNGEDGSRGETEVERSIANRSFSVDMMVQLAGDVDSVPLMSLGNGRDNVSLWAYQNRSDGESEPYARLLFCTMDRFYFSDSIHADLSAGLTRVGLIVDNEAKKVNFIYDKNIIGVDKGYMEDVYGCDDEYLGADSYGRVYVGYDCYPPVNSFKGDITELRIWNKPLNTIEVGQSYNKRIEGYDRYLMGYWPLNEAMGDKAKDKVNGATLNLYGTSWHSDDGLSMRADHKEVRLRSDAIAAAMNEDYTIRFWFRTRAFSPRAQKACIFRSGNDELSKGKGRMYLGFEGGNIVLNSMDESHVIGSHKSFANDEWHNFTLAVSRTRNNYATYLDGVLVLQGEADAMDHPDNGYIALGDSALYTNFDELAVWKKALPDQYIQQFYNSRFNGTESDMLIYMPFERQTLDSHNLPVRTFSPYNQKLTERIVRHPDGTEEKTGEMVADGMLLILDDKEQGYTEETGYDVLADEAYCAPLKTTPELSNLDFSWSSTGTALQININKDNAAINKQNIFITVRDVEDEQGNTTKSPHMWTYYVDKNVLRWNSQIVNIKVPYGSTTTEKVMWRNVSGRRSNYSIDNTASWLTLSNNYMQTSPVKTLLGIAMAEEENEVVLHVGDGISPGFYSETIYLTDEDGLSDPLHVNLTVEAPVPLWTVDPMKFEYNMNMKAVVKIKGREDNHIIDNDARDVVGAFVGRECVGMANITVKDNNSYVYMTIYGNKEMQKNQSKITFRLWSARTGQVTELRRSTYRNHSDKPVAEVLQFNNGMFVGVAPAKPDELVVSDYTEQQIEIEPGWNWIAFNVMPSPTTKTDSLFTHFSGFTEGDIIKRLDYSTFSEETHNWYGKLCNFDYLYTYQVFAKNGGRLGVRGTEPTESMKYVSVLGNKWFDLPYHLKVVQPLNVALADFMIGDKANIGDIIKGYYSFAVATENGWEGSLKYMRPGEGYYIYHSGENTSFRYPENANAATQTTTKTRKRTNADINPTALGETSMPVIAVLEDEMGIEDGDTLLAYCNGELISEADILEIGKDRQKRFFLSVNATDGNVIEFAVKRGGEIQKSSTRVKYNSSVVIGSADEPCIIRFAEEDSEDGSLDGDIYDVSGRKLQEGNLQRNGIYIINRDKVLNK